MNEGETKTAPAARLEGLVEYQSGSVTSRTLMKNSGGTVTLFAFDRGEGLSEHTAPFDAMVQLLDGQAELTIGGVVHQLSAGEMIIMPAGRPHAVKALSRFKMLLVMLREQ